MSRKKKRNEVHDPEFEAFMNESDSESEMDMSPKKTKKNLKKKKKSNSKKLKKTKRSKKKRSNNLSLSRDKVGREIGISMRLSNSMGTKDLQDTKKSTGDISMEAFDSVEKELLTSYSNLRHKTKKNKKKKNTFEYEDQTDLDDLDMSPVKKSSDLRISDSLEDGNLDLNMDDDEYLKSIISKANLGNSIDIEKLTSTMKITSDLDKENTDKKEDNDDLEGAILLNNGNDDNNVEPEDVVDVTKTNEIDLPVPLETPKSAKIRTLTHEMTLAKMTENNLQNEIKEYKKKISHMDERTSQLRVELEDFKTKQFELTGTIGGGEVIEEIQKEKETISKERNSLETKRNDLEKFESILKNRELNFVTRERQLDSRTSELEEREREINLREEKLNERKLLNSTERKEREMEQFEFQKKFESSKAEFETIMSFKEKELKEVKWKYDMLLKEVETQKEDLLKTIKEKTEFATKLMQSENDKRQLEQQIKILAMDNKLLNEKVKSNSIVNTNEIPNQIGSEKVNKGYDNNIEKLFNATQRENERLESERRTYERSLRKKDDMILKMTQQHSQKVNNLESKIRQMEMEHDNSSWKNKIRQLEDQITSVKQNKSLVENQMNFQTKQHENKEKELLARVKNITMEKKNLKSTVSELKEKMQWYLENQEMIDDQANIVMGLRSQIAEMKFEIEQLESNGLSSFKKEDFVRRIVSENAKLKKKLQDPSNITKLVEDTIKEKRNEAMDNNNTMNNPDMINEIEKVRNESGKRLRVLKQEFDKSKIRYEEKIRNLEEKIKKLNERKKIKEKTTPITRMGIGRPSKRMMEMEKEYKEQLEILQKELDEKENKTKEKENSIIDLQIEMKQLRADLKRQKQITNNLENDRFSKMKMEEVQLIHQREISNLNTKMQDRILELERGHRKEIEKLKNLNEEKIKNLKSDVLNLPYDEREKEHVRRINEILSTIKNIKSEHKIKEMELQRSMSELEFKKELEKQKMKQDFELELNQKTNQVKKFKLALDTIISDVQRYKKLKDKSMVM